MSTSDAPVAHQGRKQNHTTPSAATSHRAGKFQAHMSNSHALIDPAPKTPPRTPRRSEGLSDGRLAAPAEASGYTSNDAAAPRNSSAKPKSKTRIRPKSVVTSPTAMRTARATPPLKGAQSAGFSRPGKTPASIAYAGPTFHASPAPSALPLPSFCSKSPIGIKSARDDTSSDGGDSPTPPALQINETPCPREESPLDLFFNAHRAEKARRDGSSSEFAHFSGGHASSMFATELESANSPGKPIGPPFATPYNERIKAARSSSSQSLPFSGTLRDSPSTGKSSQALRDYLFTGRPQPSRSTSGASTPANGPRHSNRSTHTDFPFGNESIPYSNRTSGLRQEVSQTKTPAKRPELSERVASAPPKMSTNPSPLKNQKSVSSEPLPYGGVSERSQSADLLDLEERLRRQLKIEPAPKGPDNAFPFPSSPAAVFGY